MVHDLAEPVFVQNHGFWLFQKISQPVCSLIDNLRGLGVGFLPCGFWGTISGQAWQQVPLPADGHVYRLLFACGVRVLECVWKSKDRVLL